MPQPDVTQLARKWRIDIDSASSDASPVWVQIRGINEFAPNPQEGTFEADDAYEDDGWQSETKTALKWSHELKMLRRRASVGGAYDPGQEALRTRSELFAGSGWAHVRWYPRDASDAEAYEGWAEVEWKPDGGATTDVEKITVTLRGKGKRTLIANPA